MKDIPCPENVTTPILPEAIIYRSNAIPQKYQWQISHEFLLTTNIYRSVNTYLPKLFQKTAKEGTFPKSPYEVYFFTDLEQIKLRFVFKHKRP